MESDLMILDAILPLLSIAWLIRRAILNADRR